MDIREKTIKSERIFEGKILKFDYDTVILPNGREAKREIVRHPGGVGIVVIDESMMIYLVRQYRIPYDDILLEIPAGKLDSDEDTLDAAKRELSEETGLIAENWQFMGSFYPSVGFCDENLRLYMATDLTAGAVHPDEDEFLNVVKMPFDDVVKMCVDGSIKDGKTIAAVLKAEYLLNNK